MLLKVAEKMLLNWRRRGGGTSKKEIFEFRIVEQCNKKLRNLDGTKVCIILYDHFSLTALCRLFLDPASVDRILNSPNIVNERGSFNITCEASGDPAPNNYTWIRLDNGERHNGNVLTFTRISRNDSGQYKCEAQNQCGKGSRVQSIDVYCK